MSTKMTAAKVNGSVGSTPTRLADWVPEISPAETQPRMGDSI
jgi:hypothetical protein